MQLNIKPFSKLLFASLIALSFTGPLGVNNARAQSQTLPRLQQVPLDLNLAKNAAEATLLIRKKYDGGSFSSGEPNAMVGKMRAMGIYANIQNDLSKFGFSSPEEWTRAATSLALAVSFTKSGQGSKMMAQMQQMQSDPNLSAEMKAQMQQQLSALMPSKGNMLVAQQLLGDPTWRAKLDSMLK